MGPTAGRVRREEVAGGEACGVGEINVEVEAARRSPDGAMVAEAGGSVAAASSGAGGGRPPRVAGGGRPRV